VADPGKLLYLVGQFPAINHTYILEEVKLLRNLGFDISIASVSPPDRPVEEMNEEERDETARTYYIKSLPVAQMVLLSLTEFVQHPVSCLRGLFFAVQLGGSSVRQIAYHLAYFAEAVLVGRYMRQRGIRHVHANFSATVSLIATRVFPVTMSFVAHGYGELHDPKSTHLAERIKGSLFVRAVSRHGRGQMMLSSEREDWSKLIYCPLGIDVSKYLPAPARHGPSSPTVLCVGRLAPEKGQEILLDAVAALRASGRSLKLRLVGDGPDRSFLERKAEELGIAASVEFDGWVDPARLPEVYAEADICVLSSLAEGIPIVLMEAMAMQVACVAPRITGIPELIEHGFDGLLFAVADAEDLSRQIQRLLDSPDLRLQIGQAGRARVLREYDIVQNTKCFAAVLAAQLSPTNQQNSRHTS